MEHFHLNITLPVKNQADVIVIGGGSAGFTAAVHAARSGARTILIEKNGMLGGTTTTAYVNFPGLFHAWGKQVIGGIGWEAIERTAAYGGAVLPDFTVIPTNHWEHQVHVNRFTYAAVLDELCQEAGVEVHLHEMPAFVQESEEGITLITAAKEGGVAYTCKVLVDATGDADVVGLLGYPRVRSEFLQRGLAHHAGVSCPPGGAVR